MAYGFSKIISVYALLIGIETLADIIKSSYLQRDIIHLIPYFNLPAFILAPVAWILMRGVTASTTAGATIASQTFGKSLIDTPVTALNTEAMIHAGARVIDSLPYGSFFHAIEDSVKIEITDRLKLVPYEIIVGLTMTLVSSLFI